MFSWFDGFFTPRAAPANSLSWFAALGLGVGKFRFKTAEKYQEAYDSSHAAFMVVDKQATMSSSLPYVFRNSKGAAVQGSPEQALWDKLGKAFRYQLLADLLIHGQAYVHGLSSVGFGTKFQDFEIFPANKTADVKNSRGELAYYETYQNGKLVRVAELDTVLHLQMPSNCGTAKSKLSVLGETVTASMSIAETEAFLFKNRGSSKIISNNSDLPITPTERANLQASFDEAASGEHNAGKAYLTNAKITSHDLYQSPADLNLDESGLAKLRIVAGVYGLDSKIFGDPNASTYNNMAEAMRAAYTQVFIPLANDYLVNAFNKWWLEGNWKSQLRMELDLSAVDEIKLSGKEFAETDLIRMQSIREIASMPIPRTGRKSLLMQDMGYTDEQAEAVLGTAPDPRLETLKSLPPLIAGKILDKLSEEELRKIIGF